MREVLQHAPPSIQAHSFRFCRVSEQSAECSCDGFELLAVDAKPRDAVDDRRAGSTGRSGQCGPSGTSSLEKNQTEAFGIPLDISVGHGEQIARRVPARQVVVAHMAEQMHAIRYTELRREARQVFPILANANQRVMCVDALLSKSGQRPNHAIEALAPLEPPHRENETLPRPEPESIAQRIAGDQGIAEQGLLTEEDAYYYSRQRRRFEQVVLPVYRVILKDEEQTRYYLDPNTGALLQRADATGRWRRWLFSGLHRLDFTETVEEPGNSPCDEPLGQHSPGENRDKAPCDRHGGGLCEEFRVDEQRLGSEPPHSPQSEAMDRVRMHPIEIGCPRDIGGDDMDLLAAQPTEVIVERHRRPALGGQEQFGHHQERRLHGYGGRAIRRSQ